MLIDCQWIYPPATAVLLGVGTETMAVAALYQASRRANVLRPNLLVGASDGKNWAPSE